MADGVSLSMGGRVARIHRQNVKRRRYTTVINEIESKRLTFIKKQLENDRSTEYNKLQRNNERIINANDQMKAFQVALLRRIDVVKTQSKVAAGTRPPANLGRYGGASVEHIKTESEKYKRIRDPTTRRLIKARISLEQGKKDGRIKEFDPRGLGDMAEDILQLYKADTQDPRKLKAINFDPGNLDDVTEADEMTPLSPLSHHSIEEGNTSKLSDLKRATYPQPQPRRLILPPLQVKRSLNPNSNYYRKISADFHKREARKRGNHYPTSPIHQRLSILEDITEEGNNTRKQKRFEESMHFDSDTNSRNYPSKFPVTSLSNYAPHPSNEPHRRTSHEGFKRHFEWDYTKSIGSLRIGKHLNDSQSVWKPGDSFPTKNSIKTALPNIKQISEL